MDILLYMLLIYLTCILIWRASDGFEAASDYLGDQWALSDGIRGATINAIGSSMPELLTTIFFLLLLKDVEGFAGGIGTTAGSAIFNSMVIPAAVIFSVLLTRRNAEIFVSRRVIIRDGLTLISAEVLFIFFLRGNRLDWWDGLAMMIFYGLYLYIMFSQPPSSPYVPGASREAAPPDEAVRTLRPPWWRRILFLEDIDLAGWFLRKHGTMSIQLAQKLLVISTAVIATACFFLVYACNALGDALGIEVYFVAVIIASMATSVPDTFLSVRDAQRGNYDDAISNALGSNIFDICFALGFPLFMYTLIFGSIRIDSSMDAVVSNDILELRVLLVILTVFAFLIFLIGRRMTLLKAILLSGLYVVFATYILGIARHWDWVMSLRSIFLDLFIHVL